MNPKSYIENGVYCATPGRLRYLTREIVLYVHNKNHIPIHPFAFFPYELFEGGDVGREDTMAFCQELVKICPRIWIFGISEGVLNDIEPVIPLKKEIELHLEFDSDWELNADILKTNPRYFEILGKLNL